MSKGHTVDVGEWQSTDISGKPEMVTVELDQVSFEYEVNAGDTIPANLPWAEEHFLERVSGIPYNPPPSSANWPYAQQDNTGFKQEQLFSHTYPERFWPKSVGHMGQKLSYERMGIRFAYGDLMDVVTQLVQNPLTRQAYLPVWFPEDTGGVHGERVPCTLGYHFLIRNNQLTCTYYIRSCDFRRHFVDDLYMAVRLAQWVTGRMSEILGDRQGYPVKAHRVIMHIASLHVFQGDLEFMKKSHHKEMSLVSNYGLGPDASNILKGLG